MTRPAAVPPPRVPASPPPRRARARGVRVLAGLALALGATLALPPSAGSQAAAALGAAPREVPFQVGETLTYRVRVPRFGTIGRGTMTVGGPEDVRGTDALLLRFDFNTRIGFVKAVNHTESWIDPERMAALRFHKHERHPLRTHDEVVEMFPEERRWQAADGRFSASTTDAPLDELSFLYYLRTLPLGPGAEHSLERHFDPRRNPTRIRVVGREQLTTPAGTFQTVIVEMHVRDARNYKGEGVLRIHISDDARRLLVRMESDMPVVGRGVLTLEAYTPARPRLARR